MENPVRDKNIVLCVSGGIAAYKSVELLRLLTGLGAKVRVMMTENATRFVGETTFAALSGHPVCTDLFEDGKDSSIRHIDWARDADAVVVAPATANIIAKHACGIADDALSTFLMAVPGPVLICPSMNTHMYENPSVRRNLERLSDDGHIIVEPGEGSLACGTGGKGRLPAPGEILDRLLKSFFPKDLSGVKVLVTAGPTREYLDPVRFISNPSSGKMGYEIARAAEYRGADVILVSGPVNLSPPLNVRVINVESALLMAEAVFEAMADRKVIIKSAAVGDYRPATVSPRKIKKSDADPVIRLEKNPDILKELGRRKEDRILVGFAAESEQLQKYAGMKLKEKNLDMIVGNLVVAPDAGFGTDTNRVTIFHRDRDPEELPLMPKSRVAHEILDRIILRLSAV